MTNSDTNTVLRVNGTTGAFVCTFASSVDNRRRFGFRPGQQPLCREFLLACGKLICTYSTGMIRRVEIARALMGRPKVLFLDEPTRGLDLPAKRDMWGLLRRLAATESVTTFLSSHDAQEIRTLCSKISVIARGRLVHTGPTREMGGDIDAFEERLIAMLTQS